MWDRFYSFFLLVLSSPLWALALADGESEGQWTGGLQSFSYSVEGSASWEWPLTTSSISLEKAPVDWSSYQGVGFWLYNPESNPGGIGLLLKSENTATEGMDYYSYFLDLNFAGWKYWEIPMGEFKGNREPLGLDQILEIQLVSRGWNLNNDTNLVLYIDEFTLLDTIASGLQMSDSFFFAALDLEGEGLTEVKTAVANKDWENAVKGFSQFLLNRPRSSWLLDPDQPAQQSYNEQEVVDLFQGTVMEIGISHTFASDTIDWFFNPTLENDSLAVNYEWQWQLNRMNFWKDLSRAYTDTKNEEYTRLWLQQLQTWVSRTRKPLGNGNSPGSPWRTIDTGIRLGGSWQESFQRFLKSPEFSPRDQVQFLKSVLEQADHLEKNLSTGNWVFHELDGLFSVGALFPEFKKSSAWRRLVVDRLGEEMEVQFLADGAQFELSSAYHFVSLKHVLHVIEVAQKLGYFGEFPLGFVTKIEKAYDYALKITTPTGHLPLLNDGGPIYTPNAMKEVLDLFPERDDFAWMASEGAASNPPDSLFFALDFSGRVVMRDAWTQGANYSVFDVGKEGYGHVHFDKLSLIAYSFGREVLYDGGGGQYEKSIWREYATGSLSHNTASVDGLGQKSSLAIKDSLYPHSPLKIRYKTNGFYDWAEGLYDQGYGHPDSLLAKHKRSVLFSRKNQFWLVYDHLISNGEREHDFEIRWHLNSIQGILDSATGAYWTEDLGVPNLGIVPLFGGDVQAVQAQTEPEIRGFRVTPQGPVPSVTLGCLKRAEESEFLTLLLPIEGVKPEIEVQNKGREVMVILNQVDTLEVEVDPLTGDMQLSYQSPDKMDDFRTHGLPKTSSVFKEHRGSFFTVMGGELWGVFQKEREIFDSQGRSYGYFKELSTPLPDGLYFQRRDTPTENF